MILMIQTEITFLTIHEALYSCLYNQLLDFANFSRFSHNSAQFYMILQKSNSCHETSSLGLCVNLSMVSIKITQKNWRIKRNFF